MIIVTKDKAEKAEVKKASKSKKKDDNSSDKE